MGQVNSSLLVLEVAAYNFSEAWRADVKEMAPLDVNMRINAICDQLRSLQPAMTMENLLTPDSDDA